MFKKLGLTALVLVVGVALLGHTKVGRYVWSWVPVAAENLTSAFKPMITPEMEIKRIKGEIARLDDDLKRAFSKVAENDVKLAKFKAEVEHTKTALDARVKELKVLEKDPTVGDGEFAKLWDTYKLAAEDLANKEKLVTEKAAQVRAAKARYDAMKTEKARLETEIVKAETNLERVRVAQTECPIAVDDTRLSEIKAALDALDTQIQVQQRVVENNQGTENKVEVKLRGAQARDEFRARFGGAVVEEK
jgi:septal ring factor EnvC (AmiA/AmiB activator)